MRFEAEIDQGNEAEQTQWAIIVTWPISNWATVIKLTMERLSSCLFRSSSGDCLDSSDAKQMVQLIYDDCIAMIMLMVMMVTGVKCACECR